MIGLFSTLGKMTLGPRVVSVVVVLAVVSLVAAAFVVVFFKCGPLEAAVEGTPKCLLMYS
jgi:hypothetical protein